MGMLAHNNQNYFEKNAQIGCEVNDICHNYHFQRIVVYV